MPPPKPQTRSLLELRKVKTGKTIWSVQVTAFRFWKARNLAISEDGRYALTSLPPVGNFKQIALVRMSDGKLMQKFPMGVSGGDAGFASGGNIAWTRLSNVVSIYRRG